MVEQFLKTKV